MNEIAAPRPQAAHIAKLFRAFAEIHNIVRNPEHPLHAAVLANPADANAVEHIQRMTMPD